MLGDAQTEEHRGGRSQGVARSSDVGHRQPDEGRDRLCAARLPGYWVNSIETYVQVFLHLLNAGRSWGLAARIASAKRPFSHEESNLGVDVS